MNLTLADHPMFTDLARRHAHEIHTRTEARRISLKEVLSRTGSLHAENTFTYRCAVCPKIKKAEQEVVSLIWRSIRYTPSDDDYVKYIDLCSWADYLRSSKHCSTCLVMVDCLYAESAYRGLCLDCSIVIKDRDIQTKEWAPNVGLFSIGPASHSI